MAGSSTEDLGGAISTTLLARVAVVFASLLVVVAAALVAASAVVRLGVSEQRQHERSREESWYEESGHGSRSHDSPKQVNEEGRPAGGSVNLVVAKFWQH